MRALIDGQEVDVAPEALPAFYFSVEDPEEIGRVRGARSTTMNLPATNRNRRVIGGAAIGERTDDSFPFSVRNGTVSYFEGVCFVRERSDDAASVVAFGDNAAWMSRLKGKRLRDIPLGFAPSQVVNNLNINNSWDGSKDYVFPLIDYGSLEGRSAGYDVLPTAMHPALFVGKAMNKAFGEIGYGIAGAGSFKETWDKLIALPVNGPVYVRKLGSADLDNPASAEAVVDIVAPSYQPTLFGSIPNVYRYGTFVTGNSPGSIDASGTYTSPTGGFAGDVAASLYYGDAFSTAYDGITFVAVLWNQTANALIQSRTLPNVDSAGDGLHTVVFDDVVIPEGEVAYVGIQSITASPAFPNIPASASVAWGNAPIVQQSITTATDIDLAAILPDITTLDLLSWITRAFCVIPVTRGSFVELWHYDELFPQLPESDPINLTKRQQGIPVKQTEDLPSAILFSHAVDDDDRALDNIKAGGFEVRHVIGGAASEQKVEVGYSPTAMDTVMGLRIPVLRYRDSQQTAGFYPERLQHKPRLLLYEGLKPGTWTLNGQALTEYPSAISYGDGTTSFGSVHYKDRPRQLGNVSTHWQGRIRRWTAARLLIDAIWSDHEVASLSPGQQVKANDGSVDGLFYVLEINQHRFGLGEPSRTTLVPL